MNMNEYHLWLGSTSQLATREKPGFEPNLLISFSSSSLHPGIQNLKWIDSETVAFLGAQNDEDPQVYTYSIRARALEKWTDIRDGIIKQFDISAGAERLLIRIEKLASPLKKKGVGVLVENQALSDLIAGESDRVNRPQSTLLLRNKGEDRPHAISLPVTSAIWWFSLSPNGRYVVIRGRRGDGGMPLTWSKYRGDALFAGYIARQNVTEYFLIDLTDGSARPLTNTPIGNTYSHVLWANDSASCIVTGIYLPLTDVEEETRSNRVDGVYVAQIMVPSCEIRPIVKREAKIIDWRQEQDMLTVIPTKWTGEHKEDYKHEREELFFTRNNDSWTKVAAEQGNRKALSIEKVTIEEGMNLPPVLHYFDTAAKSVVPLWNPNPRFSYGYLNEVREVSFTATDGRLVKGGLYLPSEYPKAGRIPLIIQTHGWDPNQFWPDGPYSTAFAAQALAAAGFAVIQLEAYRYGAADREEVLGEVASYLGAIRHLDALGIIDKKRVGIIAFSRQGLAVQHLLSYYPSAIGAATLADTSDAGYFRYVAMLNYSSGYGKDSEGIIGGIPAGQGLKLWLENSPGFNLEQVSTPVRIEANDRVSLFFAWEWFNLLRHLRKPAELIYFPQAGHVLVKPWDKFASQQGNVDWFRFWLKGEERTEPVSVVGETKESLVEQYARWRKLRELHEADLKKPRPPRLKWTATPIEEETAAKK